MTTYKVGQKLKVTTVIYGGAVYDRKGKITNANSCGHKTVDVGILESIKIEGRDVTLETVDTADIPSIQKQYRAAIVFHIARERTFPLQIYPLHSVVGEQTVEILEEPVVRPAIDEKTKSIALSAGLEYDVFLPDAWTGESKDLEKFAKLIVKECANILDTKISPPSHPFNSIGYKLKEHFGVEQ